MRLHRLRALGGSLFISGLFVACATPPAQAPQPRAAAHPTPTSAASGTPAAVPVAHVARKARPLPEAAPAPPVVTAPMKGEPTGKALDEARLAAVSWEKSEKERIARRVKTMRAEVDAQQKAWHDAQPECWRQDREDAYWRAHPQHSWGRGRYVGIPGGGLANLAPVPMAAAAAPSAGPPAVRRAAPPSAKTDAEPAAARSASGTNNQVASVDEADIVKTDGRYVYLATNGALRIVEALNPRIVSTTRLPGGAREMFVEGDRAVVYTSSAATPKTCTYQYDCVFAGDGSSTKVLVYDIADRKAPRLTREIELTGSLIAARRIGTAIHTVVADGGGVQEKPYEAWPSDLPQCGTPESNVIARLAKLKADNERAIRAEKTSFPAIRDKGVLRPASDEFLRTAIRDGGAYTSVVSFDMNDDATPPTAKTIESRPGAVFASGSALYLSVVHSKQSGAGMYSFSTADEVSDIHKFRIGTSAKDTQYIGSGAVPGHVLSQLAMDEWHGYLRIATTRGRVPYQPESAVSVLAEGEHGNLVRVGAVEHIAPGEDIRAVRFDDDRGYVVTFRETDPLFVVDLAQPARPAILGELKIPGFSTYIHRIDREHLLSIGFENQSGMRVGTAGVMLQMFDVKNPTSPQLLHKEVVGTRGSGSAAATDHLAFNYFAEQGLLAVPMTECDGASTKFSGLYVYDVDVEGGFKRLGGVDHGGTGGDACRHGAQMAHDTAWASSTSVVKRSVFLDDLVYSIAENRAKVQRIDRLGFDVADLPLGP